MTFAVNAEGLRKRFRGTAALDGFDLAVPEGSVCGLLGPNGAGKTTAVRILATLLRPDGGRAQVAGLDVVRQAEQVRHRIGLIGQHTAVDEVLSGRENLVMFGRLHHLGRAAARRRAEELLARFGLEDAGGKPVKDYSGGMRRRLDLAAGMILSPAVLFLDEPTTGLDPRGRGEVWDAVRGLVATGCTVLLTTQYLEEADRLASKVVVVDAGRAVAEGTPDELKSALGDDRVDVVLRDADQVQAAAAVLDHVGAAPPEIDREAQRVSVPVRDRAGALAEIVRALEAAGLTAEDVTLRRPTLDEVFLHLTGTTREETAA
ncbi:daunorubicin resistance protein DrrA family ABC transporter ATP-binding protein [Planotetraspora thailandica]|uniref:Daunorubicin resistance protein DrrA family ABC transporter ATP-binding protein n=1 Tax=Planotetraspora thailandica TaxID=487172 RepID=A0A8J3Y004_9ACTN|nr:ATP-binding cassette domain-containing protein [Planotetraspora thailandica]GII58286.1 daunorubicin resistance protein DrrA family ABC transporter ATP-binding protein [Planotetraspora thailandica]